MRDPRFKDCNTVPLRPRSCVIGPEGWVLTLADLPPPDTLRWVARRKAQVIAAVHGGLLTLEHALRRYALSHEEFLEWERHYESEGIMGLRVSARQNSANQALH